MNKLRAVIAGLLLWSGAAMAQAPQAPQVALSWLPIGKIAGGYSVTTSTSPVALPAGGDTVWACNTGTNDAYVTLGNSASFGATTNSWLKAGTCWGYARKLTNGSIANYILAVTALSTTQFQVETGIGTPPFQLSTSGGGGGGGGAVYGPTAVGLAAANPPVLIGGTSDGTAAGTVGVLKVAGGLAFINCANCSGSGISVAFNGAIGGVGTPGGFKDGSGNFQPLLGDVTNGQWVTIKGALPAFAATPTFNIGTAPTIAVTGTFWPYTLGQQVAGSSVPVVLPAAQITALTPPTSVGISGTLPAFAATPTFNIGTAPTISVTGTFWQATQPVSAASLPLPAGAATATNQTGGGQKTQIVDGSGSVIGSTSNALNVAAVPTNSAGTQNSTIASNVVLKGAAGGLLNVTATIGATSGWLMLFDATSAPADGAVTPKFCRYVKSDGTGGATSISWGNLPLTFSTGITAVFSSTGCFTKTASATAFFSGQVQ